MVKKPKPKPQSPCDSASTCTLEHEKACKSCYDKVHCGVHADGCHMECTPPKRSSDYTADFHRSGGISF